MDSASLRLIGFGLVVAIVSNLSRSRAWRSGVLFFSSLLFLSFLLKGQSPGAVLPFASFLLLGYAALALLQRGWSRASLTGILTVIASYLWLKKYTFLPEASFLRFPYFTLGLSYIFFRVLHLLIESGQREEQGVIGPGAYLTYLLNFTTLVSGPIQRYDGFARDQFAKEPLALDVNEIGLQIERIIRGFFKVNILAMVFHALQGDALTRLSQGLPSSQKFFAGAELAIVYPFFLYANFSGYIDIVIALARLLRLRLPENFDRPFSSSSFLDFWNRWHITLSLWLKTYVYNPMLVGLMRRFGAPGVEPLLGVVSFFVTFFLVGIWHGRTSEFVVFGVLQGGGVAINKLWQIAMAKRLGRKRYKQVSTTFLYTTLARGLTFTWFAFTLFWFWADWRQIHMIYGSLGGAQWVGVWGSVSLCAAVVLTGWEWVRAWLLSFRNAEGPLLTSRYALVVYASVLGLVSLLISVVLGQPAPDVVYKAF